MSGATGAQAAPAAAADGELADATFFIVLNAASGHLQSDARQEAIERVLGEAGRKWRLFSVTDASRLEDAAREAVAAARECGGIVVAAGGDGTINTVAQATLGSGCAFGRAAARHLQLLRSHARHSRRSGRGHARAARRHDRAGAGRAWSTSRVFLVNASVGLYPQLLEDREAYKSRFGRSRLVAMCGRRWRHCCAATGSCTCASVPTDHATTIRTPTLFVGNNRLQLETIGIADAQPSRKVGWSPSC